MNRLFFVVLIIIATCLVAPQNFKILENFAGGGVDPISCERKAAVGKVLRLMCEKLAVEMKETEMLSGAPVLSWCDGYRHTPRGISELINVGKLQDAHEAIRYAFWRSSIVEEYVHTEDFSTLVYLDSVGSASKLIALLEYANSHNPPSAMNDYSVHADVDGFHSQIRAHECSLMRFKTTEDPRVFESEIWFLTRRNSQNSTVTLASPSS